MVGGRKKKMKKKRRGSILQNIECVCFGRWNGE